MKITWKRLFISLFIAGLTLFALARVYFRVTDDFRIANMTYEIPHHPEWEIPALSRVENEQLKNILNQKFYYIGKGAQSYAFGSEDQKYVIKFFKFKHLKPSFFLDILPPIPPFAAYKKVQVTRKERKLDSVFAGYRLAYDVNKSESGLIFIHLNKTNGLHLKVTLVDKIGLEHQIDLDSIVFVLQDKAKTTRAIVIDLLSKGNLAGVKLKIRQIFDLYLDEYSKGIYDRDHGVMHNTGFVGERPIHLDVGKLTKDERMKSPVDSHADLEIVAQKFNVWLKENYPKEYPELAQDMELRLSEIFGKEYKF